MFPSSPPPLINQNSPYARVPLPPMACVPVTLHPLLGYEPRPCIAYSIILSPSCATLTRLHLTHPRWLQEPATCPNLPYLTIRAIWQERVIVVFPENALNGFVAVWDVLVAVHRALRAKARYNLANTYQNANESALLYRSRPPQNFILPDEAAIRESMMMLVQGRTSWRGLSPAAGEAHVWLLHIG